LSTDALAIGAVRRYNIVDSLTGDGRILKKFTAALTAAIVLALAAMFVILPAHVSADAGNFAGGADYGGGGGYDGGYDGGYAGGFYYSDDGYDSDEDITVFDAFVILAVIIIVFIVIGLIKKTGRAKPAGAKPTEQSALRPMSDFAALDPEFSEEAFREHISNLYVRMQNAWTAKDFEPMRPYMTDALYTQFDRQLDEYRKNRRTNRVDNIAVLDVSLSGFSQDGKNDRIAARVRTRINDYVTDDESGDIVSGSATASKFMEYEWTLIRRTGVTTAKGKNVETVNCPNCGAPLNINATAKCEYCGSVVTVGEYNWVITQIKGISQETR
jgi:hypothetical protein